MTANRNDCLQSLASPTLEVLDLLVSFKERFQNIKVAQTMLTNVLLVPTLLPSLYLRGELCSYIERLGDMV